MKDDTNIRLVKDDSSAVIQGFEEMEWFRALFDVEVSGITALTAVLQAVGQDITFEEVMGVSGAAFKLHIGERWCPSSGCFEFDDGIAALFGLKRQVIEMNEEKHPDARERMRKAVVASIDRGIPVPYCDGEHSLLVGYRDGGAVFVCSPYGRTGKYTEFTTPRGMLGDAWYFDILTATGEQPDWQALRMASLKHAVEQAKTQEEYSGFNAYQSWANTLRDPPAEKLNLHAYYYIYSILISSRNAAAKYLKIIAPSYDEQAKEHLLAASDRYDAARERLWNSRTCITDKWEGWDSKWTPENRQKIAAVLDACLADERVAVAEIEKALEIIEAR
ncbi:hypothetical protein ACFLSJ_02835 [Verrucomicrobiota bacterium]